LTVERPFYKVNHKIEQRVIFAGEKWFASGE
jgi:hypothetical protein